ncbi:MAG: hypothetical protein KJ880_04625 [Candidatus Omnitrophica bacterium]|nr:hypothetical protein [Candidatus Omnitrophota bacterium]MBU1869563.1 hypothetical protein [Candidatus Omnitrophota bacterium]
MKRAQSTIELTLSLVVMIILLAGIVKFFVWSSKCYVNRHNAYLDDFANTYANTDEFYSPVNASLVPQVNGLRDGRP